MALQMMALARMVTSTRSPFLARLCLAALVCTLGACGDRRADFVGKRALTLCDESWPICDGIAGCILGDTSYREGHFPGEGRFIVRLAEPSVVRLSFLLEETLAAGEQTVLTWYEDGCRGRIRQEISGRNFVAESDRLDGFSREADLNAVGDHLIEFSSDTQARYVLKVDVLPKREVR
jgi:hypothetical protein